MSTGIFRQYPAQQPRAFLTPGQPLGTPPANIQIIQAAYAREFRAPQVFGNFGVIAPPAAQVMSTALQRVSGDAWRYAERSENEIVLLTPGLPLDTPVPAAPLASYARSSYPIQQPEADIAAVIPQAADYVLPASVQQPIRAITQIQLQQNELIAIASAPQLGTPTPSSPVLTTRRTDYTTQTSQADIAALIPVPSAYVPPAVAPGIARLDRALVQQVGSTFTPGVVSGDSIPQALPVLPQIRAAYSFQQPEAGIAPLIPAAADYVLPSVSVLVPRAIDIRTFIEIEPFTASGPSQNVPPASTTSITRSSDSRISLAQPPITAGTVQPIILQPPQIQQPERPLYPAQAIDVQFTPGVVNPPYIYQGSRIQQIAAYIRTPAPIVITYNYPQAYVAPTETPPTERILTVSYRGRVIFVGHEDRMLEVPRTNRILH